MKYLFCPKYLFIFFAALSYFLFLANGLGYVFGDTYEWIEYGSNGSWDYFWNHPRWDRPAFLLMHLLLFPLFGWNISGYYFAHGLFFAGAMVLVWLLAKKVMNEFFAFLAVVFVATSYDTVVHPFMFIGDAAGMEQAFVLLGIFAFLNYFESKKNSWMLLSAIALFVAMAFKQPARFMPLIILIFLMLRQGRRAVKEKFCYVLAVLLFSSFFIFLQAPYHDISFRVENFLKFAQILKPAAIFFLVAFICIPVARWKSRTNNHIFVLVWLFGSFMQLPLFPHAEPRYLIGWMFPLTLLVFSVVEKGFLHSYKTHKKTSLVFLAIIITIGMYPNLLSMASFATHLKPYLVAKESTRLFLESTLSNSLVLYHWGNIDFFGRNNEYRNYNPTITGSANLSAYLLENRSTYIIHYPRKQPEIERIENKTLYKKITNGPVEFWVWRLK